MGARKGNPIQIACRFRQQDTVELLLGRGADLHASDTPMNALSTACYYGRSKIAELLLNRGADTDRISGSRSWRLLALGAAAKAGEHEIFRMLLARGAVFVHSK
jgi:ankyrin repeat protein